VTGTRVCELTRSRVRVCSIQSSMQSDNPDKMHRKYSGMLDCTRQLYQQAGIARFYKGFTPCLLRSVPANAVMWLVFEKARSYL